MGKCLLQRVVLHCTAARGGTDTIPGGVPEPRGCGTEGCRHSRLGLGISEDFFDLNDSFL